MAPKKKAAKTEEPPLPKEYEQLAKAHLATLTAAAFLAPKGVPCTLDRLALTVRSLAGIELTGDDLRRMVCVDDRLALRFAAIASPADGQPQQQLELVLRESLKLTARAPAVNARHKRFRALLADRTQQPSEGGAAPPLALAALPANAPGVAPPPPPPQSPPRHSQTCTSVAETTASPAAGGSPASVSGLPSPPPNPLRRGLLASPPRRLSSTAGSPRRAHRPIGTAATTRRARRPRGKHRAAICRPQRTRPP